MRTPVLLWAGLLLSLLSSCDREARGRAAEDRQVLEGGRLVFQDDFQREGLGEHWTTETWSAWRIDQGQLSVSGARNAALWLDTPLPENVRVEIDATALDAEGDLKFEIFGNGRDHASGYVAIYGGWSNSTTCIARLDEHGRDRRDAEEHVRRYRLAAVRTDHRLRWFIDGREVLSYDDAQPLEGEGHRHFAFNNWEAPARYDNLAIYDLGE